MILFSYGTNVYASYQDEFLCGGIEWSLRAFTSMRAVRLFLRARAVINFLMRTGGTLEIPNGEQRALLKFSASWFLSLLKRCCASSNLADTFKTGPCYLGLDSGRSFSINVSKTQSIFSETFMGGACFPNVPSFPYGKHCFQCQFLFPRCKLCVRYTVGNLYENPSMHHFW